MQIIQVNSTGFKGCSASRHKIKKTTAVTGPNRSGKTAIIAAIQAAVLGEVDGVGSASAKLGLLADNKTANCSAEVETNENTKFSFQCRVGKTASATRQITKDGLGLDMKTMKEVLFGEVPTSPMSIWKLSGEELWSLMLPRSQSEVPEDVKHRTADLRKKAGDINANILGIELVLNDPDVNVASTKGLEEAKAFVSQIDKEIEIARSIINTDIPSYNGPAIADVTQEINAIKERIKANSEAVKNAKSNEAESARLSTDIERLRAQRAQREIELRDTTTTIGEMSRCLELVRQVVDTAPLETRGKSVSGHIAAIKEGINFLSQVVPIDAVPKASIESYLETVEWWTNEQAEKNSNSPRRIAATIAAEALKSVGYSSAVNADSLCDNPQQIFDAIKQRVDMMPKVVEGIEASIQNLASQSKPQMTSLPRSKPRSSRRFHKTP